MELKVIAYARNGHTDKFGIPRQSREESPILTRIVFEPEYNVREALRGIEGFSHLWIIWGFTNSQFTITNHQSPMTNDQSPILPLQGGGGLSFSPTVRPPRLGGNKRMGVFATRSPFRPNPIGLSSVRLLKVDEGELIVSGADVLDGTPVYDIKPYLSFSDSHPDALNGFAEDTADYRLQLANGDLLAANGVPESVARDITYILCQDPRPAYQNDPLREYKMDYDGWKVSFRVGSDGRVYILSLIRDVDKF